MLKLIASEEKKKKKKRFGHKKYMLPPGSASADNMQTTYLLFRKECSIAITRERIPQIYNDAVK